MADFENETDESLLGHIKDGNQQAFATLVRRHTRIFHAAAYRMCANEQESEDIVQDAFLKLWSKPQAWDAGRGVKFTTWFYRVVTNLAIDKMRRRKNTSGGDSLAFIADTRSTQEDNLYQAEQQVALETAIQSLPERQKAALNLCFYEGLSNREAAGILGVSVKALESLLVRARAALKDDLLRRGILSESPRRHGYA